MKMNTPKLFTYMLAFLFVLASCKQQAKEKPEQEMDEVEATTETPEITLEKLEGSPAYADAVLQLEEPSNLQIADGGSVDFSFTVNDYELGAQTAGPNAEQLANSGKGQHIHFILNNQPYSAHYEPAFAKEIPNGVHHLVAFLSRSYHESVKNENSVVVKKLEVGANATDSLGLDMEAPTLIYSRPKGTYAGKDAENLLLDFFVLNTSLSEDGNKVKATVNDTEFMITEWAPHVIKGLPVGDVTITLELVDAEGNMISGPFNKVTRTVSLTE
ncbi:hypothetical protein M3P19_10835 [Muricauda sp. 2012CJ35-5]|uniref:Phosphopeptide-binding protein n=1 Tax=Flagellimonas spongiicola TaxID=2942208 RepID=A0ABT0PT26_9FLAO|nr:hypothetical protein [Allomuricauda spongiicola]MCL6274509.1 hypothetical protein [Allomuricauda spongiicola]